MHAYLHEPTNKRKKYILEAQSEPWGDKVHMFIYVNIYV